MKLLSNLKIAALATTALAFSVLPTFAQETPTFTDIEDNVYKAEIEEAAKMGIVKGFPGNLFKPDETVSREQAAVMIVQAINKVRPVNLDEKPKRQVKSFQDVPADRWSAKAIYWLQWNLYPANTAQLTGNFRPEAPITRAALVEFLKWTAELISIRERASAELIETEEPKVFSDVHGYDKALTMQMSAFCNVASPLNEKGNAFAPLKQAHRDYTAAAIVRAVNCEPKK